MISRLRSLALLLAFAAAPVLVATRSEALDAKTPPKTQMEMQLSFAPLVKQTAGSVVNVYAERLVQRPAIFDDPFFQQFFGQQMPNRTEKQSSLGSGVIVGENGIVVTNNHVIDGASDIRIALADGREFDCEVILKDANFDLAVLKVQTKDHFPVMKIGNSDKLEVGDLVLAIGNPFGIGQTVTSGIVSGLARNQVTQSDVGFFIQTDAAINPGNSGGALVDMAGELIGINTAIFSKGGGSNGVGFAIPANLVKVFVEAAERGAKAFEKPYIGASFDPVTSDVADALGLKIARGAIVVKVTDGTPAQKAGLKPGQVVTAVNGLSVEHPDALGYRLMTAGIGSTVDLTLLENGTERHVSLLLEQAPETRPRDTLTISGSNPLSGAVASNLSPRVAAEMHLAPDATGVVLSDVRRDAVAARLGFQPKDIIVAVNGTAIDSTKTLKAALSTDKGYWQVDILRDGHPMREFFR